MNFIDLSGKRFGKITVLGRIKKENSKRTSFLCQCDCGIKKVSQSEDLRRGKIKSCGCWKAQHIKDVGHMNRKHGKTESRLYHIWRGSKERCQNKNSKDYKNYGGRGITICEEWIKDFQSFYEWAMSHGYRDDLTIDRIDVNGNYCPENCRWVDIKTQNQNKTNTVNITIKGKTKCLSEWERILGICRHTIKKRYKEGKLNV